MDSTVQWLADQCGQNRLRPKWIVADSLRVAQQWKDQLNLLGETTVNLHPHSISTLALGMVSTQLAERNLRFAGKSITRFLVRHTFLDLQRQGRLEYFADLQSVESFCELLTACISDLRLAEILPATIEGPAFAAAGKAADLQLIYQSYVEQSNELRYADLAQCLQLAADGLQSGNVAAPQDLLILLPEDLPFSAAERRLLQQLGTSASIARYAQAEPNSIADKKLLKSLPGSVEFYAGLGEVNEVRGVFQRILAEAAEPIAFDDVEIVCSDYARYAPLVLEQVSFWLAEQEQAGDSTEPHRSPPFSPTDCLPLTFSDGVPCVYSRPGRALRGWLRWLSQDGLQSSLVQLLREGLIARPEPAKTIGFSRLAATLREIPIGFQLDRYLPKIRESIQTATSKLAQWRLQGDAESTEFGAGKEQAARPERDFGLNALRGVESICSQVVGLAPSPDDDALAVLRKARRFLETVARAESHLDRLARRSLLESVDAMAAALKLAPKTELDVRHWLEQLPTESSFFASGPQPGRVHVSALGRGAYAGRRRLFIVGLNDGVFPRRLRVDPVLLDNEREQISSDLPTARQANEEQQRAFNSTLLRTLAKPLSRICVSYSTWDLRGDRANFPSPAMLELFRLAAPFPTAAMGDMLTTVGNPVAFLGLPSESPLCRSDALLSRILANPDSELRQNTLAENFSHVRRQHAAAEAHNEPKLSAFDGFVEEAGRVLDPVASERLSPSRLETYGACPRRFFFRYGLNVWPPDEWTVDTERWLDPLQLGNLVHSLFEDFLRDLTSRDQVPNADRDRSALQDLLAVKIEQLQSEIPTPNQDCFNRTRAQLEKTCEIFLQKEEKYCRDHQARPWVFEASLGLGEEPSNELDHQQPIPLALSDGRLIRIGGRLDRVDRLTLDGSERYAIWDYKSGSDYGFDRADPFKQGRKLQHFLYMGMLRHRVQQLGGRATQVRSFGYFFPSPRTNGLRLCWTADELQDGPSVLSQIVDLIANGVFVATTEKSDCHFCDYRSICGDPSEVAAQSLWKAEREENERRLRPFRKLRELALRREDVE